MPDIACANAGAVEKGIKVANAISGIHFFMSVPPEVVDLSEIREAVCRATR
jgi:hypothetical protein